MKVSLPFLQTLFETPLPASTVLADALNRHTGEVEDITDTTFNLSILADRGHDLYSHIGVARELVRILPGLVLAERPVHPLPEVTSLVSVHAPFDTVPLYSATLIQSIHKGTTPNEVLDALALLDQRSIDPVVDITNYILHLYGTPLHAFDARACKQGEGYQIGVRALEASEQVATLAGEMTVPQDSLVIENGHGSIIGLAGIKGGKESGITEDTVDILLEAAMFDGTTIRKTSKAIGLRTDASSRFEHGFAPELVREALSHALQLIQSAVGGTVIGMAYTGSFERVVQPIRTSISFLRDTVLGMDLGDDTVVESLSRTDSKVVRDGESLVVTPSVYRLDVTMPEDLADEVVRIAGYERLVERDLPTVQRVHTHDPHHQFEEALRDALVAKGFNEILTRSFRDSGEVEVEYPLARDKGFLRSDLKGGFRDALSLNERNMPTLSLIEVRMFEIGTIFTQEKEERHLAIGLSGKKTEARLRAVLEEVGTELQVTFSEPVVADNVLEVSIQGLVTNQTSLRTQQRGHFRPFSVFPYITRDVSVWVPGDGGAEDIGDVILQLKPEYLENHFVVDRFDKDGRTSLSMRLVFQSHHKTLTDGDVEPGMTSLISALEVKGYEVR